MKEQLTEYFMLILGDIRNAVFIVFIIAIGYALRNVLRSHFNTPTYSFVPSTSQSDKYRVAMLGLYKSYIFSVNKDKSISDFCVEYNSGSCHYAPVTQYRAEFREHDKLYLFVFFDKDFNCVESCVSRQLFSENNTIISIHENIKPIENDNREHQNRIG